MASGKLNKQIEILESSKNKMSQRMAYLEEEFMTKIYHTKYTIKNIFIKRIAKKYKKYFFILQKF